MKSCTLIFSLLILIQLSSSVKLKFEELTGKDLEEHNERVCEKLEKSIEREHDDMNDHPNRKVLPSNEECGVADPVDESKKRIIGGEEIKLGEYPWYAGMYVKAFDSHFLMCGGTIIGERWVISAGHCTKSSHQIELIRVGEHDIRTMLDCKDERHGSKADNVEEVCSTYEEYEVKSIYRHPDYAKCQGSSHDLHDVALFRTKEPIKFSRFVKPVCLPLKDDPKEEYEKDELYVTGLGISEQRSLKDATSSQVLLDVLVEGVKIKHCKDRFPHTNKGDTVCAGGDEGKDSCNGDSGGPLMKKDDGKVKIVGIVSYGTAMCGTGAPGVYASVVGHLQWILDTVK